MARGVYRRAIVFDLERFAEEIRLPLWRFVRGDDPPGVFEAWAYQQRTLEAQLGWELYFETISTDFDDRRAVWSLRVRLGQALREGEPEVACYCVRLRDRDVIDMASRCGCPPSFGDDDLSDGEILRTLVKVRRAGSPRWWLWAARCSACRQAWLGATEPVHNDSTSCSG